jgi:hypothetical protein
MSIEKKGGEKQSSGGVAKEVIACPASFRPRDRPKGRRQPCKPRKTHERLPSPRPNPAPLESGLWSFDGPVKSPKALTRFPPPNPGSIEDLLDPPQVLLHLRGTESLGPRRTTRMPDPRPIYWESCSSPLHKAVKLRLFYLVIPQTADVHPIAQYSSLGRARRTRYCATIKASTCTPTSAHNPLDATGTGYIH